jgi:MoaA/NifB/PqqE/SkfB family radical SAM enzyme
MKIFQKLRFYLFLITKSGKLNLDMISLNQKRIHNKDKILGWKDGYPSYCLLAPPLLSKPQANFFTTKLLSVYQWRNLPEMINLAITDGCNCSCQHCSFVSMKKKAQTLNTKELMAVIFDAQKLGVSTINLVGGEPLIHPDILSLVNCVNKDLSQVILFTNGFFLEEKAAGLKKAGLYSVIVSLDSFESGVHDRLRSLPGLFEKAVRGIRQAQKEGLLVGISTVVSRETVKNGELEKLIEFGKDLNVNEILIFDAVPTGNYSCKQHLIGEQPYLADIISISEKYNNLAEYPGIFAYSYVRSHHALGCAGGVCYFYVSPYGDVCPCDFNPMSVGNVKEVSLHLLWDRFSRNPDFCKATWNGCKMQDREFREKYKEQLLSKSF